MVQLAPFTDAHIPAGLALSQVEGWPHTTADWAFLQQHSQGFIATEGDRVSGTILWLPQGGVMATVGMVIVARDQRGKGMGKRLVRAAIDATTPTPLMLVATDDGRPLYEALGFAPTGQVTLCLGSKVVTPRPTEEVVRLGPEDHAALAALDAKGAGWNRGEALAEMLREATCFGLRDGSGLAGYAALRRAGQGRVIGPVVAGSVAEARALISAAVAAAPGAHLRIDTDPALGLLPWLEEIGLTPLSTGTVMWRGDPPAQPLDGPRIYGLASQAFG